LNNLDQETLEAAGINDQFFEDLKNGTITTDQLESALSELRMELAKRMDNSSNAIKEIVPEGAHERVDQLTNSIRNKT